MRKIEVSKRPKCPYCEDEHPISNAPTGRPGRYQWECNNEKCGLTFSTYHKVDVNTGKEVIMYIIQTTIIGGHKSYDAVSYDDFRVWAKNHYGLEKTQKKINTAIYYIKRYSKLFSDKKFDQLITFEVSNKKKKHRGKNEL
ncbi:MAG: hypothetical protein ABSG15_08690 [FCB group bacterium]|jgi:hypothetical protein